MTHYGYIEERILIYKGEQKYFVVGKEISKEDIGEIRTVRHCPIEWTGKLILVSLICEIPGYAEHKARFVNIYETE